MNGPVMYVEERDGGYYLAGTRVSLDSVVYAFLRGQSPESITKSFAPLSLEQVYGAITFYLANEGAVDEYLKQGREDLDVLRQQAKEQNAPLHAKLEAAKREALNPRS